MLETYESADAIHPVGIQGTITGPVADGRACFWLGDPESGNYLRWSEGSYALTDPLRVISPDGSVRAVSGDRISVIGVQVNQEGECGGHAYARYYRA